MTDINNRKIRMGMVGGGSDAFIGAVHRMAANLDGQIELVAGAFSSDPTKSIEAGKRLFIAHERAYPSYQQMLTAEANLPIEQRIDFVAIVTPNHLHFPVAKMALESGFHVLSDKPATLSLAEAITLKSVVESTQKLYGLTHTYTGYPMVKHARELIAEGRLGRIVKVVVEYSQGWLASKQDENSKQASWRLDPEKSGISCCMGDIGVHAANLSEYVTGQKIVELCADLTSTVEGRKLDDDGTVLMRFDEGAKGLLFSSQIAVGEENNLVLRVYGDAASIEWHQQEPNSLMFKPHGAASICYRSGVGQFSHAVQQSMRTPAGHPEGYLEAFANIYANFVHQIRAYENNHESKQLSKDLPGINEAIRGMAFIENAVFASQSTKKWHSFSMQPQENSL